MSEEINLPHLNNIDSNDFDKWKEDKKKERSYRNATEWNIQGKPLVAKKRWKPLINKYVKVVRIKKPYKRKENRIFVVTSVREWDFLKYYTLVEYWAMTEFEWSRDDLNMLLFLYSEEYFTREMFHEFADVILGKKNTLNSFITRGFVERLDNIDKSSGVAIKIKDVYRLTFKVKRMIRCVYDRVLLKTQISESNKKTKIFRVNKASYKDKRYASLIVKMNERGKAILNGETKHIKDDFII